MSLILDISAWQGTMDFAKAKKAGVEGVMCRAAYSTSVDKHFYEFSADAEKAGVPIGAKGIIIHHDIGNGQRFTQCLVKLHQDSILTILFN